MMKNGVDGAMAAQITSHMLGVIGITDPVPHLNQPLPDRARISVSTRVQLDPRPTQPAADSTRGGRQASQRTLLSAIQTINALHALARSASASSPHTYQVCTVIR